MKSLAICLLVVGTPAIAQNPLAHRFDCRLIEACIETDCSAIEQPLSLVLYYDALPGQAPDNAVNQPLENGSTLAFGEFDWNGQVAQNWGYLYPDGSFIYASMNGKADSPWVSLGLSSDGQVRLADFAPRDPYLKTYRGTCAEVSL